MKTFTAHPVVRTIAIVACIALIIGAIIHHNRPIRNAGSHGTEIIAFGDSLIEGVGSTLGHDFISLLSLRLTMPITNAGVSGNTTADGLARIDEALAGNPRLVILLLGGNDYLRQVPTDTIFANLSELIERIQARGAMVLLLGVRGGIVTDIFDERYEALSRTYDTGYVPNVLAGLLGHRELMSDGVHPNDAGYQKIADRVEPEVRRMLGR